MTQDLSDTEAEAHTLVAQQVMLELLERLHTVAQLDHPATAVTALQGLIALALPQFNVQPDVFFARTRALGCKLAGHEPPPSMSRERAVAIARTCAAGKPEKYYAEPFEPHEWVVDAVISAAATVMQPDPIRAACIHCEQDVADIADIELIRTHSMTCEKSPVVRELQRLRTIADQAGAVARHWDTQDGVNGSELDRLVALVYDRGGCPNCGAELEQDTVDVGVGEMPIGPRGCPECHWFDGTPVMTRVALLARVHNLELELAELRKDRIAQTELRKDP